MFDPLAYQRHHLAHIEATARAAARNLRWVSYDVEPVEDANERRLADAIGDRLPESLPPSVRALVGDAIVDLLVDF